LPFIPHSGKKNLKASFNTFTTPRLKALKAIPQTALMGVIHVNKGQTAKGRWKCFGLKTDMLEMELVDNLSRCYECEYRKEDDLEISNLIFNSTSGLL